MKITPLLLVPTAFLVFACGGEKKDAAEGPKRTLNPSGDLELASKDEVREFQATPIEIDGDSPATISGLDDDPTAKALSEAVTELAGEDIELISGAITEAVTEVIGDGAGTQIKSIVTASGDDLEGVREKVGELLEGEEGKKLFELLEKAKEGGAQGLEGIDGGITKLEILVQGEDGKMKKLEPGEGVADRIEFNQIVGDQEGLKREFKALIGEALKQAVEEGEATGEDAPVPEQAP